MTRLLRAALVTVGLALAPACATAPASPPAHDHEGHATLWTCSMHPEVVREEPGSCPICGMDLVPIEAGADAGGIPGRPAVRIDPAWVQATGVRTGTVSRQTLTRAVRTPGEITVAEDRVTAVTPRVAGWVQHLRVDRTGERVARGEVLLDLYAPELLAVQEELLAAARTEGSRPRLDAARRKLELLGMASSDIDGVLGSGRALDAVPLRAPASGVVLDKAVVEGARVAPGAELFRLGDLGRLWVLAEVYERDAPWVQVGQPARVELADGHGLVLDATVAFVYPTLSPTSRTRRVRLEVDARDGDLAPGMLATVWLEGQRREDVLAVPTEAVLRTGRRQIVFVAEGEGRFDPREVTTGLEGDDHLVEIASGLEPGERIVLSGQFLLDAESQLHEAVQKIRARATP